ncbi:hypothetical protein [Nitrosopumilus sp. b2]|uniref:hypothetical protein n=1 Tax=Nitrosopumilus sp. b2 TaxID=2109908 RepID=UPI0015F43F38|nr:hypothetical protein [Nitrosopumilus sp. b2]KAF6245203.1 hypothetical protein C6989_04550 [Nitrosopumilus sp. b2]
MFFKGVIIVAGIVLVAIVTTVFVYDSEVTQNYFNGITKNDSQKIIDLTQQFIVTSPTFAFDGISDSLEIKIISDNASESKYILKGQFKTLHIGYGDRTNLDLSEDITLHVIAISVVDGKIISAIIDNQWDELNQITCNVANC